MTNDPILTRFRKALHDMYGNQLDRVLLFGSRARGDAQRDSDYDVAVFLKSLPNTKAREAEMDRLAILRVDMIDETGAFFDVKPYAASAYADQTPLMHEIRMDGVPL